MAPRRDIHCAKVEKALLERLGEGLADVEVRRVLGCSLLAHDAGGRGRLYQRLGTSSDTVETLRRILEPPADRRAASAVVVGKAKVKQQWRALWQEWDACVDEASCEDGKYVHQDRDWEPPYFCADSLSSDLDAIAKRMRALLPRVQKEQLDPELSFFERIRTLADTARSGLPEGLEDSSEELSLGPETTCCLLEWEAGSTQARTRTTFELLDSLCRLETGVDRVDFDHRQIRRFVLARGEEECRSVLAEIGARRARGHWAKALENTWSGWFELLQNLSRRWDKKLHLELCAANIGKSWALAVPVVRQMLKSKEYDSASAVLDTAFLSMLGSEDGPDWDPRASLLALHWRFDGDPEPITAAANLLRAKQVIADAKGEPDTVAAVEVQLAALHNPEDGVAMLAAFRSLAAPKLTAVRKALLGEWRELVARRTLRTFGDASRAALGGWVGALVDAAVQGPRGAAGLKAKIREVLADASKNTVLPGSAGHWTDPHGYADRKDVATLGRLTLDLEAGDRLKAIAPSLHALLREAVGSEQSKLDSVRRRWFRELGGDRISSDVEQFWRHHVVKFVPDPAHCGYATCARWLAAALELDQEGGDALLGKWSKTHALKRNLWMEIARRGLPVPSGVRLGKPK